ncbi:MAG: alanine dehydrogenase [Flavobacteriaceae bacterium]|nr:alanine dehydrogenase [Flavobacteriaceae bacterium]MCI5087559.1 alanine dehydrogenase [Flavobacteriaceae bacterium]CAI8198098.1 MAG: Alanine dehydrogenase 2 [SAR116 cluster bacterium]
MKPSTPFSIQDLKTQEEYLEILNEQGDLMIGVPKEAGQEEKRVCLTPDAVAALVANNHQVIIASGAGEEASFSDEEYRKAGARITTFKKEVFECPLVLKIAPPNAEEIALLKPNSTIISVVQKKTQTKDYFKALEQKKITAIGFEYITDQDGSFPILKSLSQIGGTAAVHIAAELMSATHKGKGLLFGNMSGIPPTEVVVFGAGTAGSYAAEAALNFGASVKVFDPSVSKLRSLQNRLKTPIYTSTLQPKNILKALRRCDVAIGALKGKKNTPIVVPEEVVSHMKKGAVIIDMSIDHGGCFETSELTSHQNPTIEKYGVLHYGVPNIPARYPKTASVSISNICLPYLLQIAEKGGLENALKYDTGLRNGLYLYRGIMTNANLGEHFEIPFNDINFLIF